MNRVAVFVDAGYLFAQGSVLLAGKKLTRGEIVLDHDAATRTCAAFAEQVAGIKLLRVCWYDGTSTGPRAQHLTLAHLDDVKVRLGFVNSVGEQKGVDSLIVTDMIALARNRAIADAVLLSGDEDLRVGVQQAQEFGVRVHLVGIKPSRGSQSLFLLQEADTTHEWGSTEVSAFLACKPKAAAVTPVPGPVTSAIAGHIALSPLDSVAAGVAAKPDKAVLAALVESLENAGQLPRDIDRQLLAGGRSAIGRDLNSAEKKGMRSTFANVCRSRLTE